MLKISIKLHTVIFAKFKFMKSWLKMSIFISFGRIK